MSDHPAVRVATLLAGATGLAALSVVLLPTAMGFDAWAWVVWGREVTRFELDTTGGPSWKPLPVVVTTVVAPLGDLAPTLWLVVARTAGLLLVAGVYRLGRRFGGVATGSIAAVALVLTPDPEPRFMRVVLEGHTAPMAAALVVWGTERHLAGHHRIVLLLGLGLALLRPESWPLVGGYAVWVWRNDPAIRKGIVVGAALVPALWFGGDWWGSGSPWHGAADAQIASGGPIDRLADSLETVGELLPVPLWVAATYGLWGAWRRRDHELLVIASLAAAWTLIVMGMAVVLRYGAISRFLLPAAALLCVLAAVGIVRGFGLLPGNWVRVAAVGVLGVASLALSWIRVSGLEDVADEVERRAELDHGIPDAVAGADGRSRARACGIVGVDGSSLLRPAIAWELDVPMSRTTGAFSTDSMLAFVVARGNEDADLIAASVPELYRSDRWAVYAVNC